MRTPLKVFCGVLAGIALLGTYVFFRPAPTDFAGGKHVALSAYTGTDPTGAPPELKSASRVARGEYLTRAADCRACHTAKNGTPFIGGRAFVLPFGTLYSTNITPDSDTGIGRYTDEEFRNALHKGVGRGGTRLYPAMPYPSYAYMSDADVAAIKAYLFSLPPIRAAAPANTLTFPYNPRWLMGAWSALFNADRRYEPNVDQTPAWNRGAYLVEALEHCGECHTPRNMLFALDHRQKFAGAVQSGWRAYNITPDPHSGIGTWSDAELYDYLAQGHASGRGTAAGPMGEAIDQSTRYLTASDIRAMVTYLRTITPVATVDLPEPRSTPAMAAHVLTEGNDFDTEGKFIYAGACAGCHGWTGVNPLVPLASLTGSRAVNDPTAINVAQVIIHGGHRNSDDPAVNMPAFGETYTNDQVASVANFVVARYGAQGATLTAEHVARLREED
jgi:mono/diheme cytochrome c family protein